MGAGASLPQSLDRQTAQAIAGDRFDAEAFDAAAGLDGNVTREDFIEAAQKRAQADDVPQEPAVSISTPRATDADEQPQAALTPKLTPAADEQPQANEPADEQPPAALTRYNDIDAIEAFAAEGDVGFVYASYYLELAAQEGGRRLRLRGQPA